MASSVTTFVKAFMLITLGLAIAAMSVYVAEVDDAPGAAGMGFLVMFVLVVAGFRAARNRLPVWAGRTALAIGAVVAVFAGLLTHGVTVAAPLFAQAPDVPSVSASTPVARWTTAVDRARPLVRAAILEQNLPGLSIAVGSTDGIVWAEGFGYRDVGTRTPVTPSTRFNIGTAARVVTAAPFASLGLTSTGAEPATAWSPEAIGEEGEDFPPFTIIRHNILQPLGLAAAEYPLPDDRATFYVPRSDDNNPRRGRRLMYMRDLACCADGMAFYSTPSDLVRLVVATGSGDATGQLAGGNVVSLVTRRDTGLVVAVASNIAYADTDGLARKVADAFGQAQ
jgi:CubicO group peptidase (beta-lactamase class C family)